MQLFEGMHRFSRAGLDARVHGHRSAGAPLPSHTRNLEIWCGQPSVQGLYDLVAVRWMQHRCLRYHYRAQQHPFPIDLGLRTTMTLDTIWLIIGFLGRESSSCAGWSSGSPPNAMRKAACPRPSGMSMIGGLITLAYAIYRQDPVFIAGQSIGSIVYLRNPHAHSSPELGRLQHGFPGDQILMEPQMNGEVPSLQTPAPIDRSIQPVTLVVLLALAAVLFFVGLGSLGLTDRDEGRNAEAGRKCSKRQLHQPHVQLRAALCQTGLRLLADDGLVPICSA